MKGTLLADAVDVLHCQITVRWITVYLIQEMTFEELVVSTCEADSVVVFYVFTSS